MKSFTFAFALVTLCLINNFAQQKPSEKLYEFKGVVKDTNSAVFAGTSLFFKGNNQSVEVTANSDGNFFTQLSPGIYEININKDISDSFTAFIKIGENTINPNNVEFTVETNAICCRQSSDKKYPKLLRFPKPSYSVNARLIHATGEVIVVVKIDKNGKVILAKAESGHPLLQTVSEKAAENSRFESSEIDNVREAKLTYVFLDNNGKQDLKHYSNQYRVEVVTVSEALNTKVSFNFLIHSPKSSSPPKDSVSALR